MKRWRTLLLLLLATGLIFLAVLLPVEQLVVALQQWAEANQSRAFVVVTACIMLGLLLMLPSSVLMMLAGLLFGLAKGMAAIWLAGLVASAIAFWIGRTAARPLIERRIRRRPVFQAIDRAIQRKGLLVVFLTRIVMLIPFPALNYSLGLTGVRFRDYLIGTNIGMLPPYFLFVYLGTTVSDVAAIMSGNISLERNEILAGIIALIAVLLIVGLIVRASARVLREELTESTADP